MKGSLQSATTATGGAAERYAAVLQGLKKICKLQLPAHFQ